MTGFPTSPCLLKGGIALLDPDSGGVQRIIILQYNPDTLTRSLQIKGAGGEGNDSRQRRSGSRCCGIPERVSRIDLPEE
jgi:hypothetical protein